MKRKLLVSLGIMAFVALTAMPAWLNSTTVRAEDEPTTDGINLFAMGDFEDILEGEETEYDFAGGGRDGMAILFNAEMKAIREGENTYISLGYPGSGSTFVDWWAGLTLTEAADYRVKFDFRKTADWVDTDNVGFRFWSPSFVDGPGLATQINAGAVGDWFEVAVTYTISPAHLTGLDSIQFWFNTTGDADTVLHFDNISVEKIITGNNVPVGDNLFAIGDFEAILEGEETEYDFAGGARDGMGILFNAEMKAIREGDNTYISLGYPGSGSTFVDWWAGLSLTEPADYEVKFDFRKTADWVDSDNIGFRFWSPSFVDGPGLAAEINAGPVDEWFEVSVLYTISASHLTGLDSIQFWFNTTGDADTVLHFDNISVRKTVSSAEAPEVIGDFSKTWREDDPEDIVFDLDLHDHDLLSVVDEDEVALTADTDYVYDNVADTITFPTAFVQELGEGVHEFVLTTEVGDVSVMITVVYSAGTIPETTEGYELVDTLLGGSFDDYELGLTLSMTQTAEAWGSLDSYDDPGVIVDDGTGNHALRLMKASAESTRMYSSAFAMTAPTIELGDIMTFSFRYKLVTDTPASHGSSTNVCFVGASNVSYHLIALDGSEPAKTSEADINSYQWDIAYEEGENGFTEVTMSYIVDFALLNATNSIRFLYRIVNDSDYLLVDDVQLKQWQAEGETDEPTIDPASAAFDYNAQADVAFTVDLKDYNISSIKLNDVNIGTSNYTLSGTTLTIKATYLATLSNGAHVFTLNTLGGSVTFTITVSNVPVITPDEPDEPNVPLIIGASVGGAAVLAGGTWGLLILLKKRKLIK